MADLARNTASALVGRGGATTTRVAVACSAFATRRRGDPVRMQWLMAPLIVFIVLMVGMPVAYAIWLTLNDFHFGSEMVFVGLGNYHKMFVDPLFWNGLELTFELYIMALVLQVAVGMWLGLLLNRVRVLRRLVRTIMLSPFVMPPVVVAMMWVIILDPFLGAANYILASLGLPQSGWLSSPTVVLPVFAVLDTWQAAPFVALLILGGLQMIPRSIYEAAELDGAGGVAMFRYVTLPMLVPTLMTVVILRSVDLLKFFDLIYVITQGGPANASNTLNIYAFRRGFEFFDMGYASTLMVALTVTVMGVALCIIYLRRAREW